MHEIFEYSQVGRISLCDNRNPIQILVWDKCKQWLEVGSPRNLTGQDKSTISGEELKGHSITLRNRVSFEFQIYQLGGEHLVQSTFRLTVN